MFYVYYFFFLLMKSFPDKNYQCTIHTELNDVRKKKNRFVISLYKKCNFLTFNNKRKKKVLILVEIEIYEIE